VRVDYSSFGEVSSGFVERKWEGRRFAVVLHLLSLAHNRRLRLRVFAPDDDFPVVDSLTGSARRELVRARGFRLFGSSLPS